MIPENKIEWVGLRVLYRHRRVYRSWLGVPYSNWSDVECGVIKDITDGANILIKKMGYGHEWFSMRDFKIVEVIADSTEWTDA